LASLPDHELAQALMDVVDKLRGEVDATHPSAKTAEVVKVVVEEVLTRFTALSLREMLGRGTDPSQKRADTFLGMVLAARGDMVDMVQGGRFQRDVTPRRAKRSKGPAKGQSVLRRFGRKS